MKHVLIPPFFVALPTPLPTTNQGLFSFVLGRYRTTVMNTPGTTSSNDEGEWQDEPGTDGMAPGTPV